MEQLPGSRPSARRPLAPLQDGAGDDFAVPLKKPPENPAGAQDPDEAAAAKTPAEPPQPPLPPEPPKPDEPSAFPNPYLPGDHRHDCDRFLRQIGAWWRAMEGAGLTPPGSPAKRKRDLKHLKRADAMGMLVMLAYVWPPESDFRAPPPGSCFSLNALATMIDADRVAATSNTLRSMILPAAQRCGLIHGFQELVDSLEGGVERRAPPRHKIHISAQGLALVIRFLNLVKQSKGD